MKYASGAVPEPSSGLLIAVAEVLSNCFSLFVVLMSKIIVVPTYNERENVEALVPRLFRQIPDAAVLIVDDNSPDGTAAAVELLRERFPNLRLLKRRGKEGLGKAYIHAFTEVLKDPDVGIVAMMDADLSHDPAYLPAMFEKIEQGIADIVIGSRYIAGGGTEGWELWRRMLSAGGNKYCRFITGMPLSDCTGGFNVMRASALRKLRLEEINLSGYAFIMELKYAFFKTGAVFAELPIVFQNRKQGESKISNHIIREGVIAPWRMRFRAFRI
ncbi:MAG: polyprenol monophosphomannose synthase [Verrucomicrobiia bacterium]